MQCQEKRHKSNGEVKAAGVSVTAKLREEAKASAVFPEA